MKNTILCLLVLSISAQAKAAEVKLAFWHSMTGSKGKLVSALVDKFNGEPANAGKLKVEAQFVGTYPDGLNKVRTALMAKRGPQIIQIFDIGTKVMIDSGAIVPLADFIAKDPSFPTAEILPEIRRYYEVSGKLHSLPFATSNPILYYNADALQKAGLKPPVSFAELKEVAAKLSSAEKKTTGVTWPLHSWFFEEFMAIQGRDLVNHDNGRASAPTEALYTQPEGIAFVELWADMVRNGSFANAGRGWEPSEQSFLAGRSAMMITSTSDVLEVARKAPFKVGTAPLPKRDTRIASGTIIGGNSLWIMKGKPEEEAGSYAFLKFMASFDNQKFWHTNTGYFPIRKDVIAALEKEGFYKKYPAAQTAIDQLRASAPITATQGALMGVFQEAREHIENAIEQVLSGKSTAAQALTEAKQKTDAALQRYNRTRTRS
jgi:sn-glycerol 3-phosphate transport system substrate-binding protein